jgi:hypothetical protein
MAEVRFAGLQTGQEHRMAAPVGVQDGAHLGGEVAIMVGHAKPVTRLLDRRCAQAAPGLRSQGGVQGGNSRQETRC